MHIEELHLDTKLLDPVREFYQSLLGLPLLESENACLKFKAGNSVLYFHKNETIRSVYHFAFTISSNQIHQALDWISRKVELISIESGVSIADFKNWNAEAFYFLDPAGNIVEFIARKDLKNDTEDAFDSHRILCISEAGLVVDDVKSVCDIIAAEHGIDLYPKQPALPHFAAMGDDEGLLIIVSKNRNWYPTAIPCASSRMEIVVNEKGRRFILSTCP